MGETSNRGVLAVGVSVLALVVGGVLGSSNRSRLATPTIPNQVVAETPAATVEVHVAGSVANPGVVRVPEGSIVADAIAAAGGLLVSAEPTAVNLAAPISRGQQIVIPGASDGGGSPTQVGDGTIALNQATESELQELPGVGPVLAGRIVSHRESHGPFQTVEDLLQVPGIGEAKLASIRDLVRP